MIKQETITIGNRELVKIYSDNNKYIIQVGTNNKYTEAIDIPNRYAYVESNETIPVRDEEVIKE